MRLRVSVVGGRLTDRDQHQSELSGYSQAGVNEGMSPRIISLVC